MGINLKYISDFPSAQAEKVQKHLKELDVQGKLLDYFKQQYKYLGKYNSLANYILKNWEKDGKKIYLEWTGIETFDDKYTIKRTGVKLNEVSYGSTKYFLWKCYKCQYEWVATLKARTNIKTGCPACAGNTLIKGVNDLGTWCNTQGEYGQQLKEEFTCRLGDGTPVTLGEISKGSKQKVWWKCSNPDCSYEWPATPNDRTSKNRQGCPKCGRLRTIEASHLRGEPLDEWCDKQGAYGAKLKSEFLGKLEDGTPVTLGELSKGSNDKVYWKCKECKYEWTANMNIIKSQQAIIACYFFAYSLSKLVFMWVFQNFQVEWK